MRARIVSRVANGIIVIGNEAHVCGLIAIADSVRPEGPDEGKRVFSGPAGV